LVALDPKLTEPALSQASYFGFLAKAISLSCLAVFFEEESWKIFWSILSEQSKSCSRVFFLLASWRSLWMGEVFIG
jgi:hypothetical protein